MALKALDQVVADSADRGLHLLLILARNWGGPDSRAQVRRAAHQAVLGAACGVGDVPAPLTRALRHVSHAAPMLLAVQACTQPS